MQKATCYGYECSVGTKWDSSLQACCEPSGRSVNSYGQYKCAGDALKPTLECFNQTYETTRAQFDVYPVFCFDSLGKVVDAGFVSNNIQGAFGCSKYFLSTCYDTNGNHTVDPREGPECTTFSHPPNNLPTSHPPTSSSANPPPTSSSASPPPTSPSTSPPLNGSSASPLSEGSSGVALVPRCTWAATAIVILIVSSLVTAA